MIPKCILIKGKVTENWSSSACRAKCENHLNDLPSAYGFHTQAVLSKALPRAWVSSHDKRNNSPKILPVVSERKRSGANVSSSADAQRNRIKWMTSSVGIMKLWSDLNVHTVNHFLEVIAKRFGQVNSLTASWSWWNCGHYT